MDRANVFDFNDISLDEILYNEKHENISMHETLCKTSAGAKSLY